MSYLTKDWDFWQLFVPQILRGFGMMLAIVPITNISLGTLAPDRLKNASGLFNLTRNLGGAVGLAGAQHRARQPHRPASRAAARIHHLVAAPVDRDAERPRTRACPARTRRTWRSSNCSCSSASRASSWRSPTCSCCCACSSWSLPVIVLMRKPDRCSRARGGRLSFTLPGGGLRLTNDPAVVAPEHIFAAFRATHRLGRAFEALRLCPQDRRLKSAQPTERIHMLARTSVMLKLEAMARAFEQPIAWDEAASSQFVPINATTHRSAITSIASDQALDHERLSLYAVAYRSRPRSASG